MHINFPWAISLRFHPVSFHAGVCCQARGSYIVPGATLLGPVLIWYTINRLSCYSQQFLHKPLPFYGLVFVFLSSSSSPSFLFCFSRGLPPLYGRRACRRQLNMYNCVIAQIHNIYMYVYKYIRIHLYMHRVIFMEKKTQRKTMKYLNSSSLGCFQG